MFSFHLGSQRRVAWPPCSAENKSMSRLLPHRPMRSGSHRSSTAFDRIYPPFPAPIYTPRIADQCGRSSVSSRDYLTRSRARIASMTRFQKDAEQGGGRNRLLRHQLVLGYHSFFHFVGVLRRRSVTFCALKTEYRPDPQEAAPAAFPIGLPLLVSQRASNCR